MKTFISILSIIFISFSTFAQQVVKNVIVEHFTNTYCGICASRNPGFYGNLWSYPQALHIAYHPSSPYAACPLNMHNTSENDARTRYYGVFGGTPRLVAQGQVISASSNYADSAIITSRSRQYTSFAISTKISYNGANDSILLSVTIKKVDTSSLTMLTLYAAATEDTLFYNANNGESRHYDVFRKSFFGSDPINISHPTSVGDSVIYRSAIAVNSAWVRYRMSATAILHDNNKNIVQVERSAKLLSTAAIRNINKNVEQLSLYPIPASNIINIKNIDLNGNLYQLYNQNGQLSTESYLHDNQINIDGLPSGMYYLSINTQNLRYVGRLIKK